MALDRDELAARCLVARLSALNAADAYRADADAIAENAIDCTDALLARLRPEAVAPAPSRPEWVRITSLNAGGKSFLTVGKVYRVTGFGHRGCPQVNNDQGDGMWCLSSRGLSPDPESPTFASWEPCAAPGAAPSPAATPAAWVPSVGDVVTIDCPDNALVYHEWWHGAVGVVEKAPEWLKASKYQIRVKYAPNHKGRRVEGWDDVPLRESHVRPATSSERAAAGLPVDESAVDRVALAKVLWEASREVTPAATRARPWGEATEVGRRQSLAAADAAIAFMAKGGAS